MTSNRAAVAGQGKPRDIVRLVAGGGLRVTLVGAMRRVNPHVALRTD